MKCTFENQFIMMMFCSDLGMLTIIWLITALSLKTLHYKFKTVAEFIFWGSKITADGDCSHEIKTLFGRIVMTNLLLLLLLLSHFSRVQLCATP